jgi:hypothetical protein
VREAGVGLGSRPPHARELARALGAIVETSLKKVAGTGPRSPKVANAAVFGLSQMDGAPALAQIARLASRITFKGTLKELNGALDRRAEATGLTRDEVEELAVPTYGLENVGRRVDTFGPAGAETTVANGVVTVVWRNEAGRAAKSVPAGVRTAHPDAFRDVVDFDATFDQQFFNIAVGQVVAQVPAHSNHDHLDWEPEPGERRPRRQPRAKAGR